MYSLQRGYMGLTVEMCSYGTISSMKFISFYLSDLTSFTYIVYLGIRNTEYIKLSPVPTYSLQRGHTGPTVEMCSYVTISGTKMPNNLAELTWPDDDHLNLFTAVCCRFFSYRCHHTFSLKILRYFGVYPKYALSLGSLNTGLHCDSLCSYPY